jgi:hypothetical protein
VMLRSGVGAVIARRCVTGIDDDRQPVAGLLRCPIRYVLRGGAARGCANSP